MNVSRIFSLVLTAALALSSAAATAQPQTPEMRNALSRLAEAQHIEKVWPMMVSAMEPMAAQTVLETAMSSLEKDPRLNAEQRSKGRVQLEALAPQMAADVTAHLRSIDAAKMMREMMAAVYPKYFTQAEIASLADYYSSSARQKTAAADLARSMGDDKAKPDYTEQEQQLITDFDQSPLGQKLRASGRQVGAETSQFITGYMVEGIDPIVQKYGAILAERIKASTTP